jgi:hypothetical protein
VNFCESRWEIRDGCLLSPPRALSGFRCETVARSPREPPLEGGAQALPKHGPHVRWRIRAHMRPSHKRFGPGRAASCAWRVRPPASCWLWRSRTPLRLRINILLRTVNKSHWSLLDFVDPFRPANDLEQIGSAARLHLLAAVYAEDFFKCHQDPKYRKSSFSKSRQQIFPYVWSCLLATCQCLVSTETSRLTDFKQTMPARSCHCYSNGCV